MSTSNDEEPPEKGDEDEGGFLSGFLGTVTKMRRGVGNTFTTLSTLKAKTQAQMGKRFIPKAGVVIQNMEAAGYSNDDIDTVCRALFCGMKEQEMEQAWRVFDVRGEGELNTEVSRATDMPADDLMRLAAGILAGSTFTRGERPGRGDRRLVRVG